MAGHEGQSLVERTATIWKNCEPRHLNSGSKHSEANSVFVSGQDVYVAGSIFGNWRDHSAALWKNGEIQLLTDGSKSSRANSVFVSGQDVYVVGYEYEKWKPASRQVVIMMVRERIPSKVLTSKTEESTTVATLWKNGKAQPLADGSAESSACSVFVSGQDVYVAGYEGDRPMLWKNGVLQPLHANGNAAAAATSVFVEGEDVYAAGFEGNKPMLWKNGKKRRLSLFRSIRGSCDVSLFVSGRKVYVAWTERGEDRLEYTAHEGLEVHRHPMYHAVMWDNGRKRRLNESPGEYIGASSIFVKQNAQRP